MKGIQKAKIKFLSLFPITKGMNCQILKDLGYNIFFLILMWLLSKLITIQSKAGICW